VCLVILYIRDRPSSSPSSRLFSLNPSLFKGSLLRIYRHVLIFVPRDTQTPRVPSQHIVQLTYRFNIGMMVTLGLFHFVCNMRCIHAFDKRQEGANVFEKCDQRASPRRSPLLPSVSTIRHIRVLFMRQVFDRYQQDPLCKDRK